MHIQSQLLHEEKEEILNSSSGKRKITYTRTDKFSNILNNKILCINGLQSNKTPIMYLAPLEAQTLFPCLEQNSNKFTEHLRQGRKKYNPKILCFLPSTEKLSKDQHPQQQQEDSLT